MVVYKGILVNTINQGGNKNIISLLYFMKLPDKLYSQIQA